MQKKSIHSHKSAIKLAALSMVFLGTIALAGCAPEPTSSASPKPTQTKTTQPTKTSFPTDNSIPTPTGTLVAKGQLDCSGLTQIVNSEKPGFAMNETANPTEGSYEARALKSGGQSCKWENSSTGGWVTISMQKISPEDYRDIAANLQAIAGSANFNSTNGSQSFLEQQGDYFVAHELNNTYWLTVKSNVISNQSEFTPLISAAEKQLVG